VSMLYKNLNSEISLNLIQRIDYWLSGRNIPETGTQLVYHIVTSSFISMTGM